MKSIQDLREERSRKVAEVRALMDQNEGQPFQKIKAKVDTLTKEIDGLDDEVYAIQGVLDRANPGGTNLDTAGRGRTPITAGRDNRRPPVNAAHTAAFWNFIKTGNDAELRQFMVKDAMTTGEGSKGGFLIPEELDGVIDETAWLQGAMRSICDGRVITTPEYVHLISTHGLASGWVGETELRPETETSNLEMIKPNWGELYAYPMLTQQMLDFSIVDVQGFIINEVGNKFGEDQGAAFISGDGVKKPRGILDFPYTADADGARPFGTFRFLPSLDAATIKEDALLKIVFDLKRGYRQGSTWLLNSTTAGQLMMMKDGLGRFIWQTSLQEGQPDMLLGYPVAIDDFMPDVEGGAIPILFGNFKKGFMIVDFPTLLTLRDPYTNKPFVGFYFMRRMGTLMKNSEAIRALKVVAS
jgi:HK97 family phage major capsid protein